MGKLTIKNTTHAELEAEDREYVRSLSPEERLDLLGRLRQEGARFGFYEYPARLERVITFVGELK